MITRKQASSAVSSKINKLRRECFPKFGPGSIWEAMPATIAIGAVLVALLIVGAAVALAGIFC